uniref:Uncharacterized protein n=1 Tax=Caenorhabditis japonica TaxID=281687 RepID=A0A8R1E8U3_CAEJA
MKARFHSQGAHSINLAIIGIRDLDLRLIENNSNNNGEEGKKEEENARRQRLPSFSRFGNTAQSCCLPRTDSLDKVELFEALFHHDSRTSSSTTMSGFVMSSAGVDDDLDNDAMWTHHDTSVLKIVDDEEAVVAASSAPLSATVHFDENSNVF